MKKYLKSTGDIKEFMDDPSYDVLYADVRFEEDPEGNQFVVFDNRARHFPIKPEDNEDDIHQRITKAIWDGLGGDKGKFDNCVYISASEPMADDFYVNVLRTNRRGTA